MYIQIHTCVRARAHTRIHIFKYTEDYLIIIFARPSMAMLWGKNIVQRNIQHSWRSGHHITSPELFLRFLTTCSNSMEHLFSDCPECHYLVWWLWAHLSALGVPLFSLNSFYSAFWLWYSTHCIFISFFLVLRAIMSNNYWQSKSFFSTGWFHWCNATQGHGAKPQTSSKHIELTSNIHDQWAEETWSTAAQPKST